MRAFIALELSDDLRSQLTSVCQDLQQYNQKNINWVIPENLHITFQFLGDIYEFHLPEIKQIITDKFADFQSIQLSKPKLQLIPSGKPRLLWVNYQAESDELKSIHKHLVSEISDLGYKLDSKSLVFHVTLARFKAALQENFMAAAMKLQLDQISFSPDKITLFKSTLKPQGPIYQPLFSFAL